MIGWACTIASKINVTPKGVVLPISKLHSILAVANLLAHDNISQICYCGQILLQSAAVNCSFSDIPTPLGSNIYFAGDDPIPCYSDNPCPNEVTTPKVNNYTQITLVGTASVTPRKFRLKSNSTQPHLRRSRLQFRNCPRTTSTLLESSPIRIVQHKKQSINWNKINIKIISFSLRN